MTLRIVAALALLVASSAGAQDLSTATPIAGSWSYAPAQDGSEAVFANAGGSPQLWVHCSRATRRVTIAKADTAPAATMNVWTSSLSRSVASSFDPATGRLTIDLANYDPLLDAIASSRGRIGVSAASQPPLVVPTWAEVARVIEDCRI
jgi:hypothetical protein